MTSINLCLGPLLFYVIITLTNKIKSMQQVTNSQTLRQSIESLKLKRELVLLDMKENFEEVCESLRPSNIIRNSIEGIVDSGKTGNLGDAAIGVASGLLVKNILFKSSTNPLKKLAGTAIQALVTRIASRNSDKIKESGKNILQRIAAKLKRKNALPVSL